MPNPTSCANCKHWRPSDKPYDHCTVVNVREGWGDLKYMPARADESCVQYDAQEASDAR